MKKKKYKYLINNGYAFNIQYTLAKLSELSKKGWILDKASLFWYRLIKTDNADKCIYTIDFNNSNEDFNEYIEIFKAGGWNYITSNSYFHFFSAKPDTSPIYTDSISLKEKYNSLQKPFKPLIAISLPIFLSSILLLRFFNYSLEQTNSKAILAILWLLFLISSTILIPSIMINHSYNIKKNNL